MFNKTEEISSLLTNDMTENELEQFFYENVKNSVLEFQWNEDDNKTTVNVIKTLLEQEIQSNWEDRLLACEILSDINNWKLLDSSINNLDKEVLLEKLKEDYLSIDINQIQSFKKVFLGSFVNKCVEISKNSFFKEIDLVAFDCEISIWELEEYALLLDDRNELHDLSKELKRIFIQMFTKKIRVFTKKLVKWDKRAYVKFIYDLHNFFYSLSRKSESFLNLYLENLEETLNNILLFMVTRELIRLKEYERVELITSKKVFVSYLLRHLDNLKDNEQVINETYENIKWINEQKLSDLEIKVSKLWLIKDIKPETIKLWNIFIKIFPYNTEWINDRFNNLFAVWINYEWKDDFWFFRSKVINKGLTLVSNVWKNCEHFNINSFWEICSHIDNISIWIIWKSNLKLRKIILHAVLEYLENQEDFINSYFLDLNKEEELWEDINDDNNSNYKTEYIELEKKSDRNQRIKKQKDKEAFYKLKWLWYNEIYSAFKKVLWDPIRSSNWWSHVIFYSEKTKRTFPFAVHWSSWTKDIWVGLLNKYLKDSWISPTQLV